MDTSKLPKIQDEERESQFGYVHGVSGPGGASLHCHPHISIVIVIFNLMLNWFIICLVQTKLASIDFALLTVAVNKNIVMF